MLTALQARFLSFSALDEHVALWVSYRREVILIAQPSFPARLCIQTD